MNKRRIFLDAHARTTRPSATRPKSASRVTHDAVLAHDPDDLVLLVGEQIRVSECSCATLYPVPKFAPPPRLAREGIDMKDIVFPFRLVQSVQEEVVGVGEGDVWDRREQGPKDHVDYGRWCREREKRELAVVSFYT